MINNYDVEKHHRRFIELSILVFSLVSVGHLLRVIYSWPVIIGGVSIPLSVSWFAVVIALSMVFMGSMYLRK